MAEVILNAENFDEEVLSSDIPVLVDVWATWCGPCRMLSPTIEEIAEEYEGRIKVGKVNVDEAPELCENFGISVIPTLIVFKNGEVSETSVGVKPKEDIVKMVL